MKLETFFEKFDQFADAPDAVAKIRELVLLLAVQGKLVDQLPSDEPATKLLERIQKSKERLINERAIRRQETETINCDSAPFPIPQSWVWTRLGEVGDWGSGSTPPRGSHDLYDGGVTWLKSGELNDNLALAGSSETVTELALKTGSFRRNQPGDVLFAMYGATIGKAAILVEPAVTNQAVCGCTPFEGVSNRYLFNYLVSQRAAFHEASEGGAQPNLSKVKIVAFPFPLSPLAEQKRIVAKVDELMALCDRLALQQQERETRHVALARASLALFADAPTPANLAFLFHPSYAIPPADLRKSILTLAVQGKLVPQDPNDEPASALVTRQTEGPFTVPEKWAWILLEDLRPEFQNGASSRGDKDGEPVIVIRLADVEKRRISLDDPRVIAISADDIAKYRLEFGDTLITRVNGSADIVGSFIPVLDSMDAIYCDHFIRMKINPEHLFPAYTALIGDSQLVRDQIKSLFITTAGQKTVNQGHIRSLCIPLPPSGEQRRIVAKVEQLMALVDALETQLKASRATAANLLSALVAELTGTSFAGRISAPSGTGRRGRPKQS